MSADLQARFSAMWAGARRVATREHRLRTLTVFESARTQGGGPDKASFRCDVSEGGAFRGFIVLAPRGSTPRIHGVLISPDHISYRVELETFDGGTAELLNFVCALLDYEYKFPAGLGVDVAGIDWKPDA